MMPHEFAAWARTAKESLDVTDVVVEAARKTCTLVGKLRVTDDHFTMELARPAGVRLPGAENDDDRAISWSLRGQINGVLSFSCRAVLVNWDYFWDLEGSSRFEATSIAVTFPREVKRVTTDIYRYFAFLPGVKLLGTNVKTETTTVNDFLGESKSCHLDTLKGGNEQWEFGLVQRDNDVAVHARYKDGSAATEEQARRLFRGFLFAFSFTHGVEVWPQHSKFSQGKYIIEEVVTPVREYPKTHHPFLFPKHCVLARNLLTALVKGTEFFFRDDQFTRDIERLFWLARLATTGQAPVDVGTLTLCSVLEGFIDLTYDHLRLDSVPTPNLGELRQFDESKAKVVTFIEQQSEWPPSVRNRLCGVLAGAKSVRFADRCKAVAAHLSVPWDGVMDVALQVWHRERNPLAHGGRVYADHEDDLLKSVRNQSCLACAINILFAKLCGYTGLAMRSTVEEGKTDIQI
jgi:hypothetical protein